MITIKDQDLYGSGILYNIELRFTGDPAKDKYQFTLITGYEDRRFSSIRIYQSPAPTSQVLYRYLLFDKKVEHAKLTTPLYLGAESFVTTELLDAGEITLLETASGKKVELIT